MNETFLGILIFSLLALSIMGAIYLIPVCVAVSTEAENDPNHIYNIFWEEAGYRGHKIISASGCLFPFILLAHPSLKIENFIIFSVFSTVCGIYHSSVYRNYSVLTRKMKIAGSIAIGLLTGASLTTRNGLLPESFLFFLIGTTGTVWGGYAVYRRAQLIRAGKLST